MASQRNQDHSPKKDESTSQTSSRDDHHRHPQPPVAHHPAMGYPYPPPGQPGAYPPSGGYYAGYPHPNGYDNSYYYNHHQYPSSQVQSETSRFVRGFVIGMIALVILMCSAGLIMWLILRPTVPTFHVETLNVSNFNTSSPKSFTGTWDANVTVRNPNTRLDVYFDRIEAFIYYDDDNVIVSAFAQPFYLNTKSDGAMRARLTANITENPEVGTWVVEKMEKDRAASGGNLTFSLRTGILTTLKSGSWWTRHIVLRVFCEDLKVAFNQGNGNLVSGNDKDCVVYV